VSAHEPHQDDPLVLDHVRFDAKPVETDAIVIAAFEGWNDAGDAATTAANAVIDQCNGRGFAAIEPEEFSCTSSSFARTSSGPHSTKSNTESWARRMAYVSRLQ
jgi:hypothetical protein